MNLPQHPSQQQGWYYGAPRELLRREKTTSPSLPRQPTSLLAVDRRNRPVCMEIHTKIGLTFVSPSTEYLANVMKGGASILPRRAMEVEME